MSAKVPSQSDHRLQTTSPRRATFTCNRCRRLLPLHLRFVGELAVLGSWILEKVGGWPVRPLTCGVGGEANQQASWETPQGKLRIPEMYLRDTSVFLTASLFPRVFCMLVTALLSPSYIKSHRSLFSWCSIEALPGVHSFFCFSFYSDSPLKSHVVLSHNTTRR